MEKEAIIYSKLENFIRKYYTNELLRGTLFFVGIGLLYFLLTLFIEYFLWLRPAARTLLFILVIVVEGYLFARLIVFPLFKLFKLQKGIDHEQAAKIIGIHFLDVRDKLTNFLQLQNSPHKSELIVASIEQKAASMQVIPFSSAINFNVNKKFLPLALVPVLIVLLFFLSGNFSVISQSLNRVVHFKQQFLPPAPFKFQIINTNLQTEQGTDFILKVKTIGVVSPESVTVFIDDESYLMERDSKGAFQYVFLKPVKNTVFHIESAAVISEDYTLAVVTVPSIVNFEMKLNFPSYLNRKPDFVKGTGNAIIPEGTVVTWVVNAVATSTVDFMQDGMKSLFSKASNSFSLTKKISSNTNYQVCTSNKSVLNFERLAYQIVVVKDQFPTIFVNNAPDSLKVDKNYVVGQVADDYGLSKLNIVYYPKDRPSDTKRGSIAVKADVNDRFVFQFPSNLPVLEGVTYDYFFEVFDNDAPHGFKSAKSAVFAYRENTQIEKEDLNFKQQNENINSLSKSLQTQSKQLNEMDKLKKIRSRKGKFGL